MHAVCGHGRLGHITVLVEDSPFVTLTHQLGCARATLGGVEGLQGLIEFGVVKVTGEAPGGFWVGVGGSARTGCPPHVICRHRTDTMIRSWHLADKHLADQRPGMCWSCFADCIQLMGCTAGATS